MNKKKVKFKLPWGSNWVLWYPFACVTALFDKEAGKWLHIWLRFFLLFTAIPFWYGTAKMNVLWLGVIVLLTWAGGIFTMTHSKAGNYTVGAVARAGIVALFWVSAVRLVWQAYIFLQGFF